MCLFCRQAARVQEAHIQQHLEIPRVRDTWLPGADARGSSDAPSARPGASGGLTRTGGATELRSLSVA